MTEKMTVMTKKWLLWQKNDGYDEFFKKDETSPKIVFSK